MNYDNVFVKEITKHDNIKSFFEYCVENYGNKPLFCYKVRNEYQEKTYEEVWQDVKRFSAKLQKDGYVGKKIALVGLPSYEWLVAFFSIMNAGAVAVTLDKELNKEVLAERIEFSDSSMLFYGKGYDKLAELCKDSVICKSFSDLEEYTSFNGKCNYEPKAEDLALICFTSGTTSKSKAVMLSQKNIMSNSIDGAMSKGFTENAKLLAVLPLNHAFAVVQIFGPMYGGSSICINESLRYFLQDMKYYKPTTMLMVPLMINTVYNQINKKVEEENKTQLVNFMRKLSRLLNHLHIDIRKKAFSKIREVFGGNLTTVVSGGAYLNPDKILFFRDLGVNILQGYGITECSPVVSTNTDKKQKIESVGYVMPYNEVRIVNGEVQVKGDNVMLGYYKNEEDTKKAFDGEWFKTGDLGYVDEDGFLYITGRIKNLIILSNGENIVPEEIEAKIEKIQNVCEVIVAEKNDKICAQIYLGENDSQENRDIVKKEIIKLNKTLPSYSKIQITEFREKEFKKNSSKKIIRNAE